MDERELVREEIGYRDNPASKIKYGLFRMTLSIKA